MNIEDVLHRVAPLKPEELHDLLEKCTPEEIDEIDGHISNFLRRYVQLNDEGAICKEASGMHRKENIEELIATKCLIYLYWGRKIDE
tara:strand:- start:51216 stop:51476 length:261 start_codon:yes stop_codon:yes gene_type:complete